MKKIKFYGLGGQGAVTAAKILSIAVSLYQDEYAITVPAYGHERRGAPVYAHIIVDDKLIDMGVNVGEGCGEDTVVVLNTNSPEMIERYRDTYGFRKILACDATACAMRNIGLSIPNSAMLGALARTGVVDIDAVIKALNDTFGKNGEKNGGAAKDAYENTREA